MVRKERLELSRLTALEPKSSASTNSATLAFDLDLKISKTLKLSKPIKRVLYLKFAYFDKIKPSLKHKKCLRLPITLTSKPYKLQDTA
jgi:hypothetical protein